MSCILVIFKDWTLPTHLVLVDATLYHGLTVSYAVSGVFICKASEQRNWCLKSMYCIWFLQEHESEVLYYDNATHRMMLNASSM